MKVAIIDIGSNSIRLLMGSYRDGQWHNEPKRLWTTRLGARHADGTLTDEAMEASFQALQDIRVLTAEYGVQHCFAYATSAVREAPNGIRFMERAAAYCSMEWSILSGEEEAIYGFKGAIGNLKHTGLHYMTVDIGGGSTELALGTADRVYWSRSYPVGAVRMRSVSDEGIQRIWEETRFLWDPLLPEGEFGDCIGIGGTITTLAAIDLKMEIYDGRLVQGHKLTREAVEGIILQLRYMNREERLAVPGLQPGRADIIVPGAEILSSLMDTYEIPHILVSEEDGMEALQERVRQLVSGGESQKCR